MTAAPSKRNLNVEFPNHSFCGDLTTDGFGEKKEQGRANENLRCFFELDSVESTGPRMDDNTR